MFRPSRSTVIRSATAKMSCRLCEIRTTASPWSARRSTSSSTCCGLRDAERGGRLVEDHEPRVPHHRARDGDRLPLAAGERRDRLADRADRRHGEALHRLGRLRLHHRLLEPLEASRAPRGRGTCSGRRRGCRRARDPGRRPRSRASRRPSARGCGPARRRRATSPLSGEWMPATHLISVDLPAPLSPTSAITSPGADLEVDVRERLHRAEALRDPVELEQRASWPRRSSSWMAKEGGGAPYGTAPTLVAS